MHIITAISSLVTSGLGLIYPSQNKLKITYALTGIMLATGFYLVLTKPEHMTQTCAEGLVYLAAIAAAVIITKKKLANAIN